MSIAVDQLQGLILAGGGLEEDLQPYEAVSAKGLLTFGTNQTLLDRVAGAMTGLGLNRIVTMAPPSVVATPPAVAGVQWEADQGGLLDNVLYGLTKLDAPMVMIVTVDLPFLTTEDLKAFIEDCRGREADVYVPILSQEVIEAAYPGAKRTYGKLREGRVTSGNVFLVSREGLLAQEALLKDLLALRKKPLRLALRVGIGVLVKLLLGRLSVGDVENVVGRLTGATAAAVMTQRAALGMDVDKPLDYELARERLGV